MNTLYVAGFKYSNLNPPVASADVETVSTVPYAHIVGIVDAGETVPAMMPVVAVATARITGLRLYVGFDEPPDITIDLLASKSIVRTYVMSG